MEKAPQKIQAAMISISIVDIFGMVVPGPGWLFYVAGVAVKGLSVVWSSFGPTI